MFHIFLCRLFILIFFGTDEAASVRQQVLPTGSSAMPSQVQPPPGSMPPPKSAAVQPIAVSLASPPSSSQPIAPQPGFGGSSGSLGSSGESYTSQLRDKKQLKRAANRRSAQLSRKRKKAFIEELKEENDDLRRKEQILKSIPDLIVVFDSSGKLWFVSASVGRFLSFSVDELEGTSFWDRLCQDSVRLLKAAFMDSLAARQPDSDTAPLGSGVWELRLVDQDGSHKIVTLNGVVHFAGERPECVCSIRPREDHHHHNNTSESTAGADQTNVSFSSSSSRIQVKPQQSVVSSGSSSDSGNNKPHHHHRKKVVRLVGKRGEAVRISDSGNSSMESESGSSDELTAAAS